MRQAMMGGASFGEILSACEDNVHARPYFDDLDEEAPATLRSPMFDHEERDVAA